MGLLRTLTTSLLTYRTATLPALVLSTLAISDQTQQLVTISTDTHTATMVKDSGIRLATHILPQKGHNESTLLSFDAVYLHQFSAWMHQTTGRCGGFFVEADFTDMAPVSLPTERTYTISQNQLVEKSLEEVTEKSLRETIVALSQFRNRYYRSEQGVNSQTWVRDRWLALTTERSDVSARLIEHDDWQQPSVEFRIEGQSQPEQIVVIGGHGDSIAGWFPSSNVHAPGADDNASGIAAITEVIKMFGQHPEIKPERTIVFYSYAAEEVGLRGSAAIATDARQDELDIVGVMQLDMTNFKGSSEDIVFMTDYTDTSLTIFAADLAETYLKDIKITTDRCGYACSDHASWHRSGYRAIMPFEAKTHDMNEAIHSKHDTLERSNNRADHAVAFAKLGVAFAIELGFSSAK